MLKKGDGRMKPQGWRSEIVQCQFCGKDVKAAGKGIHEARCPKNPNQKGKHKHAIVKTKASNGANGSESTVSKKDFIAAYNERLAYTTGTVEQLIRSYAESINVPYPAFAARIAENILSHSSGK
jgi:hypothetical protein